MFAKVLIGVDGRSGGCDALRLARQLAAPGAELVLGHVWNKGAGVAAAITGTPHPSTAGRELLDDQSLRAGVACSTALHAASSVPGGLHELAEALGCDLLVVGSCERQRAGRTLLGSRSRAAFHAAPCAVAVAPRGHSDLQRGIETVGVGYVESRLGEQTLAVSRQIASASGAGLELLLVITPAPGPWLYGPYAYLAELDDATTDRVQDARERLDDVQGCGVDVCRGQPAPLLRELSTRVDLLVLGSRSYGPARRVLFGSTSDTVVQGASCPVLVLIRPIEAVSAPLDAQTAFARLGSGDER